MAAAHLTVDNPFRVYIEDLASSVSLSLARSLEVEELRKIAFSSTWKTIPPVGRFNILRRTSRRTYQRSSSQVYDRPFLIGNRATITILLEGRKV